MYPYGPEYDEFGNPTNMGVYSVEEHMLMRQQAMMQAQAMGGMPMNGMSMNGMPMQQPTGVPYNGMPHNGIPMQQQNGIYPQQHRQRATTKKDILTYVQNYARPSEVEQVESFDTVKTRHICRGFKEIVLLDKQVIQVPTTNGYIGVEVFFCPRCRKLLINSQSLEVY